MRCWAAGQWGAPEPEAPGASGRGPTAPGRLFSPPFLAHASRSSFSLHVVRTFSRSSFIAFRRHIRYHRFSPTRPLLTVHSSGGQIYKAHPCPVISLRTWGGAQLVPAAVLRFGCPIRGTRTQTSAGGSPDPPSHGCCGSAVPAEGLGCKPHGRVAGPSQPARCPNLPFRDALSGPTHWPLTSPTLKD